MKNSGKGISKDGSSEATKLPFEPASNRKKSSQPSAPRSADSKSADSKSAGSQSAGAGANGGGSVVKSAAATQTKSRQSTSNGKAVAADSSSMIPDVVSKRMARRMAVFSGIPTGLGMLTFVISYVVVSQHLYKLPTVAVFLVSLGCFGLGVLGLSYGALSASWDEDRPGGWFGWSEFRVNLGRAIASWKAANPKA